MINILRYGAFSLMLPLIILLSSSVQASCNWPAWQQFKQDYISEQGRVIDSSDARKITTSEGQSYALFFALVANDQQTFATLLSWTQNNLAQGDLRTHLPAWLWGENDQHAWTVLDENSASDADLWIAYTLLEASHLWKIPRYQAMGMALLRNIVRSEVANLPGIGPMLLPGQNGFVHPPLWTLNPSYQPPQILARLTDLPGPWAAIRKNNQRMLLETSPKGFVADWIDWHKNTGWQQTPDKHARGSYDAIRVYLWAGMMADNDPDKAILMKQWQPMAALTAAQGYPPESVDVTTGKAEGRGNSGFSAALLPFLAKHDALATQRQRVAADKLGKKEYFNYVLTLFGQGWDQQRYRFDIKGRLLPHWDSSSCVNSH